MAYLTLYLISTMAIDLCQERSTSSHKSATSMKGSTQKISATDVVRLAAESGIVLSPEHETEWAEILSGIDEEAQTILAMEDYLPKIDLEKYPRTDIHVPLDTVRGGWTLKVSRINEWLLSKCS